MNRHNLLKDINVHKLVKERKKLEKSFIKRVNKKFNLNIRLERKY